MDHARAMQRVDQERLVAVTRGHTENAASSTHRGVAKVKNGVNWLGEQLAVSLVPLGGWEAVRRVLLPEL